MQKRGKTSLGKQRWLCKICNKSSIRQRKDHKQKSTRNIFNKWLLKTTSQVELASLNKLSRGHLSRVFKQYFNEGYLKYIPLNISHQNIVIADGVNLQGRYECCVIIRNKYDVLTWEFGHWETKGLWRQVLSRLQGVDVIVCDGRPSLISAVQELFPSCKIQRCISHLMRDCLLNLTQNPKKNAGKDLRQTILNLSNIKTKRQKRRWLRAYRKWCKKYHNFLNEKTSKRHKNKQN